MTMSELIVEPGRVPLTWDEFRVSRPRCSIALDGYVYGRPELDLSGPWANFNHHEEVRRMETRSTCAQILLAVQQGLFLAFRRDDLPFAHIYANDCDEDVCLSVFLLRNSHLISNSMNPLLGRLVAMEDALDTTAGAYPYPSDLASLEAMRWIFEPYQSFRASGDLERKEADSYRQVILDVGLRIQAHLMGQGKRLPLDVRYTLLRQGSGWSLVQEQGAQARAGMVTDKIHAYVSVRERPQGGWTYSIGRVSPFVPFDVPLIMEALNAIEGCGEDQWGGGDIIGGSPRVGGSKLNPDEVFDIVEGVVQAHTDISAA